MPQIVTDPDLGEIEFPDSMSNAEMAVAIRRTKGQEPPRFQFSPFPPVKDVQPELHVAPSEPPLGGPVAALGSALHFAGQAAAGGLADIGSSLTGQTIRERQDAAAGRQPKQPSNIEQVVAGEQPAYQTQRKLLSTPLRIASAASSGLVESAPQLAAVGAAEAVGIPAPIAAAGIFGSTPQGFDPKQAAIAAALPFVGKYSGEITGAIAKKFGVTSTDAVNIWKAVGGVTGAAGYAGTIDESEIESLPPEQRKDARIDMIAGLVGQSMLGPMGVKFQEHGPAEMAGKAISENVRATQPSWFSDRQRAMDLNFQPAPVEKRDVFDGPEILNPNPADIDLPATWRKTPNATRTLVQQESGQPEHQRIPQGQDLQPNPDEIRQAQGGQAGGGSGPERAAKEQAPPPNEPVLTPQPITIHAYHFTTETFDKFDPSKIGSSVGHADPVAGFYLTTNPKYKGNIPEGQESEFNRMDVSVTLKNPLRVEKYSDLDKWGDDGWAARKAIEAAGYDGVIMAKGDEIVAFHPDQIQKKPAPPAAPAEHPAEAIAQQAGVRFKGEQAPQVPGMKGWWEFFVPVPGRDDVSMSVPIGSTVEQVAKARDAKLREFEKPAAEVAEPPPAPPETKPETRTPPQPKKPTTVSAPVENRTPAQILNQAPKLKVTLPEGATMIRVTDTKGRTSSQFLAQLNKGSNPFRGVDIAKVEAGIVDKNKKFKAVSGEVGVEEVGRPAPLNMAGQARLEKPAPQLAPDFEALHPKSREKFEVAWKANDSPAMMDLLDPANKGLRAEFERRMGVKLPRTITGTKETVERYFNAISSSERAAGKSSVETPASAAAEASAEIEDVSRRSGQRPAKFVKAELVKRIEDEIDSVISESAKETPLVKRDDGTYAAGTAVGEIEKTDKGKFKATAKRSGEDQQAASFDTEKWAEWFIQAMGSEGKGVVKINIPGDGDFTIVRRGSSMLDLWKRASRIDTKVNAKPKEVGGGDGRVTVESLVKKATAVYGDVTKAADALDAQASNDALMRDSGFDEKDVALLKQAAENLRESTPLRVAERKVQEASLELETAQGEVDRLPGTIQSWQEKSDALVKKPKSKWNKSDRGVAAYLHGAKRDFDRAESELPEFKKRMASAQLELESVKSKQATPQPIPEGLTKDQAAQIEAVRKARGQDEAKLSQSNEGRTNETTKFSNAGVNPEIEASVRTVANTLADKFPGRISPQRVRVVEPDVSDPRNRVLNGMGATARQAIERTFGRRIIFLDVGVAPSFNGVTFKEFPGAIFVNVRSQKPYLVIVGHEMVHHLENAHPELYRDLVKALEPLMVRVGEYRDQLNGWRKQYGHAPMTEAQGVAEVVGNFVGDSFADSKFWDKMAAKDPGLFTRVARAVLRFLSDTIEKLGGYGFISDIDKAHDIVADALTKFAKSRGEAPPPETERPVAFSLAKPDDGPESSEHVVQIAGKNYTILDKGNFSPAQSAKSEARARDYVGKTLFLPGQPDQAFGRQRGPTDANMVFVFRADGFNHDAEGHKLLAEIEAQIQSQHHAGGDPAYVSTLVNMVKKNFVAGNFDGVFSKPLINELAQLTASESRWRAQMLRAITGLPEDLHAIARNADLYLRRVYANAFGGGELDSVFKRILTQFRNFFTENDYKEIQDALGGTETGKKLHAFFDQLDALRRSEAGGRLYKVLQGKFKPKLPLTTSVLEAKSFLNEEAAKIIEEMAKLGLKPVERPGKKKLDPMEELRLMVRDNGIARVEADVARAIAEGERNAGVEAMIKAVPKENDPSKKAALMQDIELMKTDPAMRPDDTFIEAGLNDPKFAHWRTIRDNWLGYSPTSLDLVQRVIRGDFKGTRFADAKVRPTETRIDLNALAKSPEAEVERVLGAHLDNVRHQINIDDASAESKQRVERMIKEQVAKQLEQARQRVRDPMFAPPKDPAARLTPEQAIGQKIHAGLFKDPRLDIAGMVERVAAKGQIKALLPNLNDIVKRVFETPIYRQAELSKRFSDALIEKLGVTPEQVAQAAKIFEQAFADKFSKAKAKALASAKESLSPTERKVFQKRALWQKIERLVNAGGFDSGEMLRTIAAEKGWKPPSDFTVETMRKLAIREQELRDLNPKELAALGPGATPEKIEEARSKKEAATTYERADLVKRMGIMWAQMTRPIRLPLTKGYWSNRKNFADALNELNTFNLLAKVGFTLYRLPMHLTTQLLGHLPTRAIARAMELRKADIAAGNPITFMRDVGSALHDSAQATLLALRPALVAARAEMLGRGQHRNVDRLLSGINGLERLFQQAKTYWDNGDYARSILAHFFAWPRVMAWYVSAVDHWQGTPVEYADIIHRVEMSMRDMGRSKAEIESFKGRIFDMMKSEIAGATAEAQRTFDGEGLDATPARVREAAWRIVRRNIYNAIERAGLPADDFEADNTILANTQSWQVPTTGGAGMIVAAPLQAMSKLAASAGLPMPLARFTNAIATSINYSLMWTPAYKLADFGKGAERSTWFRTDFDRSQRLAQAALGTMLGGTALALLGAGAIRMTPPWIMDKDERDKFEREGHKLNTLEIALPGGKFIPVSLLVGPLTLIAPYLYFGGAMQRLFEGRTKAQAKLNEEAKRKGVTPGKIRPVSALEMLTVAGETAWGATLGNRSVSGLSASVQQFGSLNANKAASSVVAPQIPGLPGYQELSRAMGVAMDKNLATVWDYLVPLPTSRHRAVNMLGDPVGTPDDLQRIIQTMTSGTYPGIVDPSKSKDQQAYKVLFESGYRPPTINPNKGYLINGEFRPMNDRELSEYTVSRGTLLKQGLSALPDGSSKDAAKSAFGQANATALQKLGAQNVSAAGGAGGESSAGPSISSPASGATRGTGTARAPSVVKRLTSGRPGSPRLSYGGGRGTAPVRLSSGRTAHRVRLVHGRLSAAHRTSPLRGRARIGLRKPRVRLSRA